MKNCSNEIRSNEICRKEVCRRRGCLVFYFHNRYCKAEYHQLNQKPIPYLGYFANKMWEIKKTKVTFIISVFRVVNWVHLVFSTSNFFTNKIPWEGICICTYWCECGYRYNCTLFAFFFLIFQYNKV